MNRCRGISVAVSVLAIVMLPVLSVPVSAASYSWTLSCKGSGYSTARWDWLQDGQAIVGAGGTANCDYTGSASGGGDRPSNANGFTATLSISGFCYPEACVNSKTVTKSFDPAGSFSVSLKVSFSGKYVEDPCFEGRHHPCSYTVSGSAAFTLSS